MDVILLKDVDGLGLAGDIVNVKPGYARNYLAPLGLALRASKRNLAVADEKKNVAKARNERANKVNQELADALAKVELTIEMQVGEEEKLFGSVTTQDLHKALLEKDLDIIHKQKKESILNSLNCLFPQVCGGGYYIIEDMNWHEAKDAFDIISDKYAKYVYLKYDRRMIILRNKDNEFIRVVK